MTLADISDTQLIAGLRAQLVTVTAERDEARAAIVATIDDEPEALRDDDKRASKYWFVTWRESRRMLVLRIRRLERAIDEVTAEGRRQLELERAETERYKRLASEVAR